MAKPATKAIAAGVSLTLAFGMAPTAAIASEDSDAAIVGNAGGSRSDDDGSGYDKADFYSEEASQPSMLSAFSLRSLDARSASVAPMTISQDMLYFGAYEGGTYDRTFSYGDGYHAMGYYQFDHRYGLQDFLVACYDYNPERYWMFEQFDYAYVSASEFRADGAIRQNGQFTDLGNSLIVAWQEAYAAAPDEFSRLQDGWAYQQYYMPAENYLASQGIDISDRNDAVKGLCWSLTNLFGTSGWKKFVGGVSDGYDWDGVYHYLSEGYVWPGAGLDNDMTDAEFVSVLCDYVVENVSVFYKGQPQYHQGWQNRYVKEKAQCLSIIERTGDTHLPETDEPGESEPESPETPETPETPDIPGTSEPETPGTDEPDVPDSGEPENPADEGEAGGDDSALPDAPGDETEGDGQGSVQQPDGGDSQNPDEEAGDSVADEVPGDEDGSAVGDGDAGDSTDGGSAVDEGGSAKPETPEGEGQQPGGSDDGTGEAGDGTGSGDGGATGGATPPAGETPDGSGDGNGGSSDEGGDPQDPSAQQDEGDGNPTASNDDENGEAASSDAEKMPQTNDRSAGLIAALVGGFALAFGVASGTLRRILGRWH